MEDVLVIDIQIIAIFTTVCVGSQAKDMPNSDLASKGVLALAVLKPRISQMSSSQ